MIAQIRHIACKPATPASRAMLEQITPQNAQVGRVQAPCRDPSMDAGRRSVILRGDATLLRPFPASARDVRPFRLGGAMALAGDAASRNTTWSSSVAAGMGWRRRITWRGTWRPPGRRAGEGLDRRRQYRAQHDDHPLQLPDGGERGAVRPRGEALGGSGAGAELQRHVLAARRDDAGAHGARRAGVQAARACQPAGRRG